MLAEQRPLNAMHLQDHVAKACHWSDGGSEFVFADGTVLSFMDEMKTFVAVHASKPKEPRDLMLTSLCLSTYAPKVRAALDLYNRFAVRPRLIHGLHNVPEAVWRKSSPIDALVLADDPSLFSRQYVRVPEGWPSPANEGSRSGGAADAVQSPLYHMSLECAMRKVRLTVHPSRELFVVTWPARVSETDGSTSIFVPPANGAYAAHTALASQRACHYVTLTQWFVMDVCPPEWDAMVRLCFALDRTVPHTQNSASTGDTISMSPPPSPGPPLTQTQHASLTTPTPLGAPRVPSGMSSYVASRACYSGAHTDTPTSSSVRFSNLQPDDAHAFIAATHIHSCPPQQRLHSAGSTLAWRYDADPSGRTPAAWFRSWVEAGGGAAHCIGLVQEDDAILRGVRGGADQEHTNLQTMRVVVRRSPPPSPPASLQVPMGGGADVGDRSPSRRADALANTAAAVVLECREYVQDTALSYALPRTLNTGLCTPILGPVGALMLRGTSLDDSRTRQCPSVFATAEAYGRYLPSTSESVVSILGRQLSGAHNGTSMLQQQQQQQRTAHAAATTSSDWTSADINAPQRAVKLTSRVDGVGTFTALTNGVVRAVFDDRVLLALIPDASDSDEGLVCEMRGRDGEVRVMRVTQCMPTHEMAEYLSYLLPFRSFARMSADDQRELAYGLPPTAAVHTTSMQHEQVPYATRYGGPTASIDPLLHNRWGVHRASTDASSRSAAADGSKERHHVSSLDLLVMNASGSISMSESIRNKSIALLQQL